MQSLLGRRMASANGMALGRRCCKPERLGNRKGIGFEPGSSLDAKQSRDECNLAGDVPFSQPSNLPFANHVYGLNPLKGARCRAEGSKSLARSSPSFHCPMILRHYIVQIAHWSTATTPT